MRRGTYEVGPAYPVTMPTRTLAALALVLVACGDETTVINNYGTGGAAAVGASGVGGDAGATGAGGDDSSGKTSSASASVSGTSVATSTGAGGDGGEGGATSSAETSSGSGGEGGAPFVCPDVECGGVDASCAPGCGPFSNTCNGIECTQLGEIGTAGDVTTIVFPAVTEQHEQCAEECDDGGAWLSMKIEVPNDVCVVAYGPPGSSVTRSSSSCTASGSSCLISAISGSGRVLVLAIPPGGLPFRSMFTVELRPLTECDGLAPEVACAPAGCNGAGG